MLLYISWEDSAGCGCEGARGCIELKDYALGGASCTVREM